MTLRPCRWSRTRLSSTARKFLFGQSPHLMRGFSQTPGLHSFAHAGEYPFLPVFAFSQSLGKTSGRPRNRPRKSAILADDVAGGGRRPARSVGGASGRDRWSPWSRSRSVL